MTLQLSFGSGALWGERTDVSGSGIGPRQFGVLQNIRIDLDGIDEELHLPMAIKDGQCKISGKAKFAQILGLLYSDIFFGPTPATGQLFDRLDLGYRPTFKATFYTTYAGSGTALRLNACMAGKLSLPTKTDTWTISEFDFAAHPDASGTIGYLSTVE